jgi:hypothetical protein
LAEERTRPDFTNLQKNDRRADAVCKDPVCKRREAACSTPWSLSLAVRSLCSELQADWDVKVDEDIGLKCKRLCLMVL